MLECGADLLLEGGHARDKEQGGELDGALHVEVRLRQGLQELPEGGSEEGVVLLLSHLWSKPDPLCRSSIALKAVPRIVPCSMYAPLQLIQQSLTPLAKRSMQAPWQYIGQSVYVTLEKVDRHDQKVSCDLIGGHPSGRMCF